MKYTDYVNPFHGNGFVELPKAEGIAKTWYPIKALYGNTHPGATLPFGKYSVCPFSAGYASGYGNNVVDPEKYVPNDIELLRLRGFSHFQQSGTGFIVIFYNYAVTTPYYGERRLNYAVEDEVAYPGYYSVTLKETDIFCELTATDNAAFHRYTFKEKGGKISVDFSNDGLHAARMRGKAENLTVERINDGEMRAAVTLRGVRFYFTVRFEGDGALDENCIFCMNDVGTAVMKLSAVNTCAEESAAEADRETHSFDEARAEALEKWETALSKIEVTSEDKTELELFYSSLYHTIVKPADWKNGGGFLWNDAPFVVDFATMWDMYKTQLPLVYTLYAQASEHIVESIRRIGEITGALPHAFLMAENMSLETNQGRLNAVHTLYDAAIRGIKADWEAITKAVIAETERDAYKDFTENGECARTTHTLDMAEGCAAAAEMAHSCGMESEAARLEKLSSNMIKAFDPKTGLLWEDRVYYEGNHWNYSFRPLHNMCERIALCGKEKFEELLDRFFGFTHAADVSARFEGFNNESDLESPYAYAYIGRQDKLCRIIDAADKYAYRQYDGATGKGGLPGNNDSGGMTSCYIWNTLGIFPATGQDLMFIARPKFEQVKLNLSSGKSIIIKRIGDGAYPTSATLNGVPCEKLMFKASDMMNGGELIINT